MTPTSGCAGTTRPPLTAKKEIQEKIKPVKKYFLKIDDNKKYYEYLPQFSRYYKDRGDNKYVELAYGLKDFMYREIPSVETWKDWETKLIFDSVVKDYVKRHKNSLKKNVSTLNKNMHDFYFYLKIPKVFEEKNAKHRHFGFIIEARLLKEDEKENNNSFYYYFPNMEPYGVLYDFFRILQICTRYFKKK